MLKAELCRVLNLANQHVDTCAAKYASGVDHVVLYLAVARVRSGDLNTRFEPEMLARVIIDGVQANFKDVVGMREVTNLKPYTVCVKHLLAGTTEQEVRLFAETNFGALLPPGTRADTDDAVVIFTDSATSYAYVTFAAERSSQLALQTVRLSTVSSGGTVSSVSSESGGVDFCSKFAQARILSPVALEHDLRVYVRGRTGGRTDFISAPPDPGPDRTADGRKSLIVHDEDEEAMVVFRDVFRQIFADRGKRSPLLRTVTVKADDEDLGAPPSLLAPSCCSKFWFATWLHVRVLKVPTSLAAILTLAIATLLVAGVMLQVCASPIQKLAGLVRVAWPQSVWGVDRIQKGILCVGRRFSTRASSYGPALTPRSSGLICSPSQSVPLPPALLRGRQAWHRQGSGGIVCAWGCCDHFSPLRSWLPCLSTPLSLYVVATDAQDFFLGMGYVATADTADSAAPPFIVVRWDRVLRRSAALCAPLGTMFSLSIMCSFRYRIPQLDSIADFVCACKSTTQECFDGKVPFVVSVCATGCMPPALFLSLRGGSPSTNCASSIGQCCEHGCVVCIAALLHAPREPDDQHRAAAVLLRRPPVALHRTAVG